ncbi:MAG: NfeD family protein [Butyribacter sp.]|nr:NfeD family protein [bacterium]MDY3853585.1 NfeD family protein [Butyribacter sp.]
MEPVYWLIAVGVFLVLEILTMGLTTIWFAGGALVAFLAGMLGAPLWIQVVLFLAVSIVLLIFTRPIAEKHLNSSRTKTNVDEIVGKQGKVIEKIDNFNQTGKVILNGMEWMARSQEEDCIIPDGARVEVTAVEGAHVLVKPCPSR